MNDAAGLAGGGEQDTARQSLHRILFDLWQHGGNALVAWMPTAGSGIEVLTVPKIRLFNTKSLPRRVFHGERMMGQHTFQEVAAALAIQPVELRLALPVGDDPNALSADTVEGLFANFAVTKTDHRAVILIDVVGFSTFTPEEQASQLATLEFALNIAVEAAREQGISISSARSTTGDGFYIWNLDKGFDADVGLVVALVLFTTYHSLLRRRVTIAAAVPEIRVAVSIGSHYSYRQPRSEIGRRDEYIVGDVTISLARLLVGARAGQVIIGDFQRPRDDDSGIVSTRDFVEIVARRLDQIQGLKVLGNPLRRFAFYLTGPRQPDGSYRAQRLRIVDKHGFEHFGFNAKINIFLEPDEAFYCGLQHAELLAKAAPG